ncbi:MAG: glycoside hydrolase [Verrucomicrobiota bacterium]
MIRSTSILLSLTLLMACAAGAAEIENAQLRVVVEENGSLKVTDKRNGRHWEQQALSSEFKASSKPQLAGGKIEFTLALEGRARQGKLIQPAEYKAVVALEKDQSEVTLALEPSADVLAREWHTVRYPFVFLPPSGPAPYILYPHGEGMLIPANRTHPDFIQIPDGSLYGGVWCYLNCIGTVELESGAGMLAIPEPFEAGEIYWPKLEAGAVGFEHGWQASRYKLDRPLSLRWQFTDQGGYVSMAKNYRAWCGTKGWRKTLREKAKENPEVDKLLGAPIFWAYGDIKELNGIFDKLRAGGMQHCVLGLDQRLYYGLLEPDAAQLAQRQALVEKVRAAGFLVHHYDNYRDAFARDPEEFPWMQMNMDAYPHDIVVREDGQLLSPGFQGKHGRVGGVITPGAFLKYARSHFPSDLKRYPWNARFIDCVGSCGFTEGVDWHPGRSYTSIYYTREQREALMKYSFKMGQVTGTECGLDYLISSTCWFDGAMSLVRYVDLPPGTFALQTANADGSVSGKSSADEVPLGGGKPYAVSESIKYRVPFWSLVHHDDAVVTWRWENGMNHPMEHWRRKLLLNFLHGTPPMYRMDLQEFLPIENGIAATNAILFPWLSRVGFEEMTDHRFLTADRTVQMSCFSSGAGIVVNFGQKSYRLPDGQDIPPEGYACFTGPLGKGGAPKQCEAPKSLSPAIGTHGITR